MKQSYIFLFAVAALVWECRGFAQSFVFPGVQTSTEAGLSQTNTRGVTAVLWNPANIIFTTPATSSNPEKKISHVTGLEAYADISILDLNYTYARSGFAPTRISVTAPPITMGMAWRPQPKFAFALIFVPRPALQAQEVKGLPYEQGGAVSLVNAQQKNGSIISGFGFAVKPDKRFSLGLAAVETAEDGSFSAIPQDDGGSVPLIQMSYKGSFFQFIAGGRVAVDSSTTIGGSFKTSAVKKYNGQVSIAGGTPEASTKQGYLPSVFALGFEKTLGLPQMFGEYRREGWAAGAASTRAGTPSGAESKAYKDVNILIVGGRYRFKGGHAASGAFGYYPANVGFGSAVDANGSSVDGDLVSGVEFGDFDNLDRNTFAGGYKHQISRGYLMAGMNYQSGSRTVPSSHLGQGTYSMSVITIAFGGAKSF